MGSLQLEILKILWARGWCSVADVHLALASSGLAPTTVATMLRKMEARELVEHREDGRRFLYRARVAEREVTSELASDVLERAFAGRLTDMVQHLLSTHEVSAEELQALARLVAEHRRKKP